MKNSQTRISFSLAHKRSHTHARAHVHQSTTSGASSAAARPGHRPSGRAASRALYFRCMLAAGRSPSLSILASMASGVLPTGKFEGRQQLRDTAAHVCVFADHGPPPKLEGIVQTVDIDEECTEYEYSESSSK